MTFYRYCLSVKKSCEHKMLMHENGCMDMCKEYLSCLWCEVNCDKWQTWAGFPPFTEVNAFLSSITVQLHSILWDNYHYTFDGKSGRAHSKQIRGANCHYQIIAQIMRHSFCGVFQCKIMNASEQAESFKFGVVIDFQQSSWYDDCFPFSVQFMFTFRCHILVHMMLWKEKSAMEQIGSGALASI